MVGRTLQSAPTALALVLALALILPFARPTPAAAQTGDAVFVNTSADSNFPEWISFRLQVESETPIEAAEVYWRPAGDPVLAAGYPEVDTDAVVELEYEVDMTVDYLPPGIDIIYFWRVIDIDGTVSESAEQTLFYMDKSVDWQTRTDALVTLYWSDGDDSFASDIVETANRTLDTLSERFSVEADEPIRLVIYGDDDDFSDALPPNSAEWIGGQAHPGLNAIVAYIDPDFGAEAEIGRMIPHEVSHLILHQATENPFNSPPNWLDEGLAVYNQETEDRTMRESLDDAIEDGQLIPVRALNSSFPLDPDQAYLSYAESWSIVTFIIEELGDDTMAALVDVFRQEVAYDDAVERSLGMTVEQLDAAWKEWLGYDGDRPVAGGSDLDDPFLPPAQTDPTADDDLSQNEALSLAACSAFFALTGLGLAIVSIRKVREINRRRRQLGL
jgi:hypothetical protein